MHRYLISILILAAQTAVIAAPNVGAICAPDQSVLNAQDKPIGLSRLKRTTNFPELLGWVEADNLCGGYFYEPENISAFPNPAPIDKSESTITTTGKSVYRERGPIELEGDVTFTQEGREVTADKVILHRNPQTSEISCLDLYGNVQLRESGKMLRSDYTHIDIQNNTWQVSKGVYHIERPSEDDSQFGWGVVDEAVRQPTGELQLTNATYTTCAPTDTPWYIKAKEITLDKETGRGTARHSWLYAGNIPVFYTPYANFPIDKRRKSGFLYPSVTYNRESGVVVNVPYYLNLAPNYDATLTLTPMTRRGLQITGLLRYLTQTSEGYIQASTLPDDSEFERFKTSIFRTYPSSPYNDPFLRDLDSDSNTRSAVTYHNGSEFNDNWSAVLDFNWVSDDYYYRDFGSGPNTLNRDQLLNQVLLKYQGAHWKFLAKVQVYQTLHIINDTFVADQYKRLPQLSLDGSYPNQLFGINFDVNTEWVYFDHVDDYFTGEPYPTGSRFHLNPQISRPFVGAAGYITPTLGLDVTSYSVSDNAVVNTLMNPPLIVPNPDPDLNTTRVLPMFSLDMGLYFERAVNLLGKAYRQTLEPRAFYLYVPSTNQDDIPVFDTTLPTFDIDQLFRMNRFVGYDRIGDANQIALGLTSRLLDDYTGKEKMDVSVGGIYYLKTHSVCLYPDCSDDNTIGQSISPIAGQIRFRPDNTLLLKGTAAWDPNQSQWDNAGVTLVYEPKPQTIFKIGYNYVLEGDLTPDVPESSSRNNLQRLDLGVSLQIRENWRFIADWNYNLSHRHTQDHLYGIEYNSCCVAVRLVYNRAFLSEDINGYKEYRNNYYIQFLLKGLGTVGNRAAGDLILNALPGYQDEFR